jgi:predicted glutamine amidotransferase
MSGGSEPVKATFWLLEAPDSLAQQSHKEPDGAGVGTFEPDGTPVVSKQPLAAYDDQEFAHAAHELESPTFVAHVRYASTGGLTPENTHPFEQRGRLFAHNGVIGDLGQLERHLGEDMNLVRGDTDSERFFALITREIEGADGDIAAGIGNAANWVASKLPVFSLNFVLVTPNDLWALRYPDNHELHLLERASGGLSGSRHLDHGSAHRSVHVRSGQLAHRRAVVVATEMMDEDPGWCELGSGQLLHVDDNLATTLTTVIGHPPSRPLTLSDLDARAAASQRAEAPR